MWLIQHYQCRACGPNFPVPWADPERALHAQARPKTSPCFSSVLLRLFIIAFVIASPIQAVGTLIETPCPAAAIALERYIASQGQVGRWPLETIQIDASLPKLAREGRLRAIRRLLPTGRPQYQVLETTGDPMVKHEVIARYLSTDQKTAELSASSVAINPTNYRFRYIGTVLLGNSVAYAFRITPRKKREGLMKGLLWLDSETGVAVRQSGYLVKSPSVFVKHVNFVRENCLHDGLVQARVTHLSIDTRLVGGVELVIEERSAVTAGSDSSALPAAR